MPRPEGRTIKMTAFKKCCGLLGASLVPSLPVSVPRLLEPSDLTVARDNMLVARVIPTEPGIPKPL
jgi:hypothetical protein